MRLRLRVVGLRVVGLRVVGNSVCFPTSARQYRVRHLNRFQAPTSSEYPTVYGDIHSLVALYTKEIEIERMVNSLRPLNILAISRTGSLRRRCRASQLASESSSPSTHAQIAALSYISGRVRSKYPRTQPVTGPVVNPSQDVESSAIVIEPLPARPRALLNQKRLSAQFTRLQRPPFKPNHSILLSLCGMSSDADYASFLEKANQPTSSASTQSASQSRTKGLSTKSVEVENLPSTLKEGLEDLYYVSDADEPFELVGLKWDGGKGALNESEYLHALTET